MATPIGSDRSSYRTTKTTSHEIDHQSETRQESVIAAPSMEDQFDLLVQNYVFTVCNVSGEGAQEYIDIAYDKLTKFASKRPELKALLPTKVTLW